jgi:uncharacterized protein YjiK
MRHQLPLRIILTACLLLVLLTAVAALPRGQGHPALPQTVRLTAWKFQAWYELPEIPEPSGMCFVQESNSLYIVDDGGPGRPSGLYQVSLDGEVKQRRLFGRDLEGVCFCAPERRLYVADEADERVYVVELDDLSIVGSFQVSRYLDGEEVLRPGGNGIEGIEYVESTPQGDGDFFLLLNQDDPHALVRINRSDIVLDHTEPVPLVQFIPMPELNLGELHYDAERAELWVIHSWQNVYQVLDIDSYSQLAWEVMPGVAQEAVCLDDRGRLWIGSDTGGLSLYTRSYELVGTD